MNLPDCPIAHEGFFATLSTQVISSSFCRRFQRAVGSLLQGCSRTARTKMQPIPWSNCFSPFTLA